MAENPSGPQASTAVGSSSPEGPLRARLPQAQAENILASLAGRSSAPPVPVHNGHVAAKPTGGPQGGAEPRAQAGPRATGLAPGTAPAGDGRSHAVIPDLCRRGATGAGAGRRA